MKFKTSLFIFASSLLALPTAMATISVTNGTFGTTNRNARTVDGSGWFESNITTDWVEGSWSNGNTTAFPTGMVCLFDGAAPNAYIYQKLGTADAADIALGMLRITCDFSEKFDDATVDGTFHVYAGTMASPANGTDIAGAGLTTLFSRTMTAADQGLSAASGQDSRQSAKLVGDIDISSLAPGTELWIRVSRPSSGGGDFIIDNLAAAAINAPFQWDINGNTAGAGGASPAGTWDAATANWTTTAAGTESTTAWVDGKSAAFAAGTDATGSYTVTVSGTRTAASLATDEGTVLLSGGQINLVSPATLSAATGSQLRIESILGGTAGVSTSGSGTTVLAGANSYSGTTTLGGAVNLDGGAAVPDTSPVVGVGGAVVTLLADESIGDLTGAGSIALGGKTLSVGTTTAISSFGGGFTGTGSLIKQGSGTLTLTSGSSMTGAVIVNAGTLSTQLNSASGVFASAASVTINNGGTLASGSNGLFGYNNANARPVTVNAGGVLTVNGGTGGGPNIYGTITLKGGTVAEDDSIHPTFGSYNFGGSSLIATDASTSLLSARDFQLRNAATTVQVDADSTLNVTGYFTGLSHATDKTLNKSGTGKLILASATASSHGPTNVNEGTLELTGVHGPGKITIATGATLAGTGTSDGLLDVQAGAFIAPGITGTGTLTTGAASLTGTYQCQINGTACDKLAINGNLTFDATSTIAITTPGGGATEAAYVIATCTGTRTGTPLVTGMPSGYSLDLATPNQVRIVKPTGFSSWASTHAGGQAANLDYDGDGVPNGIEYFMGATGSTLTTGPAVTGLTVSWTKSGSYTGTYGTDYRVEISSTLAAGSWTMVPASDPNLSTGSPLQYTLPNGQIKVFTRLVVTGP